MVTAKLCYDYSHIPVIVGIKTTKIISYTLDGFLADVFGRSEGQVAKWEEEGVDLESLLEDRNDDEAQALKSMKTASMIEDAWNNGTLEESEKSIELHKTFLIRNLIDLREKEKQYEQRKADAENLMKQLRGTHEEDTGYERFQDACDNLSSIRDRKAMEKERCLEVHGLSLSKVILADIAIAAMDLTSHRREQLALASDYKLATDGPEKAKIRTKIKLIDMKKKALKHKIKKNYHFQLSHHRNSLIDVGESVTTVRAPLVSLALLFHKNVNTAQYSKSVIEKLYMSVFDRLVRCIDYRFPDYSTTIVSVLTGLMALKGIDNSFFTKSGFGYRIIHTLKATNTPKSYLFFEYNLLLSFFERIPRAAELFLEQAGCVDLLLHPATLRRNEIVAAGGRDWRSTIVKIGIFLLGRSRSSKYHEAFMITLHWGKSSIEGFLEILHTVADQSSTATELQLSTFHFLHHYYTSGYHGITDEDENISLMKVLEKILSRAELDIERKLFSLSLLSVILGKSVQIETFEYVLNTDVLELAMEAVRHASSGETDTRSLDAVCKEFLTHVGMTWYTQVKYLVDCVHELVLAEETSLALYRGITNLQNAMIRTLFCIDSKANPSPNAFSADDHWYLIEQVANLTSIRNKWFQNLWNSKTIIENSKLLLINEKLESTQILLSESPEKAKTRAAHSLLQNGDVEVLISLSLATSDETLARKASDIMVLSFTILNLISDLPEKCEAYYSVFRKCLPAHHRDRMRLLATTRAASGNEEDRRNDELKRTKEVVIAYFYFQVCIGNQEVNDMDEMCIVSYLSSIKHTEGSRWEQTRFILALLWANCGVSNAYTVVSDAASVEADRILLSLMAQSEKETDKKWDWIVTGIQGGASVLFSNKNPMR
eukprot:g5351.t1